MNLVSITNSIASTAGSISGIRGAYGQEHDTIPVTPWVVVGMPRAPQVIPGNRQVTNMDVPVRLYVEEVSDRARDSTTIYGFVNGFVTTFAATQSLGGGVTDCYITAWDTGQFDQVGGAWYVVAAFTLTVTVHETVTQAL